MVKTKKKLVLIFGFIFALLVGCLGWLALPNVKANADEGEEPKHVSLAEFQYFNTNSEDSQNVAAVMGKYGMLLRFDDVLSDKISEVNGGIKTVNLIDTYGEYILINDIPLTHYSNAEICYYFEEYIWVYIPYMDTYRKLSVNEAFLFEDRIIEPFAIYTAYKTYDGINYYNTWTASSEEYLNSKTQEVEFKEIVYNNIGYKYFAPKNGLLLAYDKKTGEGDNATWANVNLSAAPMEKEGGIQKINLLGHTATQNSLLGEGKSVGENVFLDGIPFKDIPGAEIHYHSERYVWFYVPNMINYGKFEITDHTLFLDSYLQGTVLYSNGNEWVQFDPNASRKDTTGLENVEYDGIEWNNTDYGYRGGRNGLLIKFSDNLSKLRTEIEGCVRNVNKVSIAIGDYVRINGEPLNTIDGAEIFYHSEQFLWVYVPAEKLLLSGDAFPCLTIDEGTEFLNAILPQVTLYFDGSYWQESQPNTADYAVNNLSEIKYNNLTVAVNEGYAYTIFAYADEFDPAVASRPNFAQIGEAGQKIRINGKTLNELYQADNNTDCSFSDQAYGLNTLAIVVRKADLNPTAEYPVTTLTIENGALCMDRTLEAKTFYLVDGKWSETSASSTPTAEDKNAPYIYYYGEENYLFITGDAVTDFSANVVAFDEVDGVVNATIEVPEDAITDGKWNNGSWTVTVLATDSQGNQAVKEILVTVINPEQEFLSIYVNGKFSYRVRYGDKIEHGKDDALANGAPEKADTETSYFVFAGWACNGKLWNFETDVVTEEVWLSPTYREYKRLFSVTILGENGEELDFLTAKYGDVIDFSAYAKEGYVVYAQVADVLLNKITVKENMTVQLRYASQTGNSTSSCSSSIYSFASISMALMAVSFLLYKKVGKKAGEQ